MARSKAEIKALIAGARRPERVVPIPMRGDLMAEIGLLEVRLAELQAAAAGPAASLSGSAEARQVAEHLEQLRAQMQESCIEFRVRGLARTRAKGRGSAAPTWDELVEANPPREGNVKDREAGVNMDEFHEQLLRACLVDPVLDDDDWAALLEALTDGTYSTLVGHCYGVNQRDVDVPFSFAASQILGTSVPE